MSALLIAGLVLASVLLVVGAWLWIAASMGSEVDNRDVSRLYAERQQERLGVRGWADVGEEEYRRANKR